MSALAEMLHGKETLWRELSAAWDCSLPGAALVFGVTGAASGAGLGLKSGTYYYITIIIISHFTSAITTSDPAKTMRKSLYNRLILF